MITITNSDLNASIQLPGQQPQTLFIFALKDLAGATIDLPARDALTKLARKCSKSIVPEQEAREDIIAKYGKLDEKKNYAVRRDEVIAEKGKDSWDAWRKEIKEWESKPVVETEAIPVPVYAEDVEALHPDVLTALADIVTVSLREGEKPASLRKENEKLKAEVAKLEGQIKSILETVTKKKE